MYLHLGKEVIVRTRDVLGIFDLDTATISQVTRDYLARAEKAGRVVSVTDELPKSFIVTTGSRTDGEADERTHTVFLSQISAGTLRKRSGFVEGLKES